MTFDLKTHLKNFSLCSPQAALFDDSPATTQQAVLWHEKKPYPVFINQFWTSGQRKANALHEISYRACFKAQLPGFFIQLLTKQGDTVYDPFAGRGTTVLEAGLQGRHIIANDINPLSRILSQPRFFPPRIENMEERLADIPWDPEAKANIDLSMFYHPRTEAELVSLRAYFHKRRRDGNEDALDQWIRMVATNRLTGHSPGFFSVYTLPPNQAVSADRQKIINERRGQIPPYRDTQAIILKKSRTLLREISPESRQVLAAIGKQGLFLNADARNTPDIPDDSVALTVTSPPFLDIVQYDKDNWLRCWFNRIDSQTVAAGITQARKLADWTAVMAEVFVELYRITRPGGWVAFEVGEVRKGKVRLEEPVLACGIAAGFDCQAIMINQQDFTKTANIWGVNNNACGTNSNRIVIFKKG